MRLPRPRQLDKRLALAKLAFALAALVLIWPIHYRAVTGGETTGFGERLTFSVFETRTCPWELRLGSAPSTTSALPNTSALSYSIDSYNDGVCAQKRYSRASQAVLWLIVGTCLMGSAYRRRIRPAPLSDLVPIPN